MYIDYINEIKWIVKEIILKHIKYGITDDSAIDIITACYDLIALVEQMMDYDITRIHPRKNRN